MATVHVDGTPILPTGGGCDLVYRTGLLVAGPLRKKQKSRAAVCASGVRILLYPGYLHSKTLCRDQMLTCIGSPSLDTRSMMIDEENCAVIADAAFTALFMEQFRCDEAICTTYAPDPQAKKKLSARLLHLIYALE